MLKLENLQVKINNKILFDINLEIKGGEYFVLLGPSGVGKTVLVETIINLEKSRPIGYLPQDLFLFPHLNVRDNILYGARERKIPVDEQGKRFDDLVSILNIENIISRDDVRNLSLGEKQRVALARALIVKPEILFLDEPFASIDEYQKRILQLKLKEINRRYGITIFHITHNREEAFMLGDRLAIMINGKIQQIGTHDEIYYHPNSIGVARFMLNQNIFEGRIEKTDYDEVLIKTKEGVELRAKSEITGEVFCGIRPEEIAVIRPDRPIKPSVEDNRFNGKVSEIFEKGGNHIIFLEIRNRVLLEVIIPNCAYRDMEIGVGKTIEVCLKKSAIWVLPVLKNSVKNFVDKQSIFGDN